MVNLLKVFTATTEGNKSFLFFFRSIVPIYLNPETGKQHRRTKAHVLHDGYMRDSEWMAKRMTDEWQWILHTYMMVYEVWRQTNIAHMNTIQIWQHYCTGWSLVYKHNSNQTLMAGVNQWHTAVPCSIMRYIDNIHCSVKAIMMVCVMVMFKISSTTQNQIKSNIHIPLCSFLITFY